MRSRAGAAEVSTKNKQAGRQSCKRDFYDEVFRGTTKRAMHRPHDHIEDVIFGEDSRAKEKQQVEQNKQLTLRLRNLLH